MNPNKYFLDEEKLAADLHTLPVKNTTLIVSDFDDTIFSRHEQLLWDTETSRLLVNNRWSKGNEVIKNAIGIDTMMDFYYKWKPYPKTIVDKMTPDNSLILTAGLPELQKAKILETGLEYLPFEVVLHAEEKPQRLLEYVINHLKYIPKVIEIYEDRPEHFLATKNTLEKLTKTVIEIYYVELVNNHTEPTIKKL